MIASAEKKTRPAKGWLRKKANLDTRQEILDAAAIEFSEKGYEGTSLRDIAKRVGIKPPSIYNHFKSKNEILSAFLQNAGTLLFDYCTEAMESAAPEPRAQLEAFVVGHVRYELEKLELTPMMNRLVMRSASLTNALDKPQQDLMQDLQRKVVNLLCKTLEAGKELRVMEFEDLTVTTFAILGSIEHVAYWYQRKGRLSATEVETHLAKLALCTVQAK